MTETPSETRPLLERRHPERPLVFAIVGPTATGKSALALTLAARFGGEIINCDSTAVYRGFDIGTDKLPPHQRRGIPHHLVDVVAPTEVYTAARYASDVVPIIRDILARGRVPLDRRWHGLVLSRADARPLPGARRRRCAQDAARIGSPRSADPERLHRWLARVDSASAAHPASRSQAARAGTRSLSPHRPPTDGSLC